MNSVLTRILLVVVCALMLVAIAGCDVIGGLLGGSEGGTVGEPFTAGGFEATVTEVRVVPKVEGFYPEIDTPADGWALAIVTVTLTNTGDEPADPPTQMQAGLLTSADPDLQVALTLTANGPYNYSDMLGLESVPSGETTAGILFFPVKTDATLQELVFRDWVPGEDDIVVDLGDTPVSVEPAPAPAAIGESIEVNGLKITVHGVKFPGEYSYESGIMSGTYSPEGNGQYVEVDFTIENVSNPTPHDAGVENATGIFGGGGPGAAARVYADGEPYFPDNLIGLFKSDAYPSPYWTSTDMLPIEMGQSSRGYFVFIAPKDASELLFEYRQPTMGPEPQFSLK